MDDNRITQSKHRSPPCATLCRSRRRLRFPEQPTMAAPHRITEEFHPILRVVCSRISLLAHLIGTINPWVWSPKQPAGNVLPQRKQAHAFPLDFPMDSPSPKRSKLRSRCRDIGSTIAGKPSFAHHLVVRPSDRFKIPSRPRLWLATGRDVPPTCGEADLLKMCEFHDLRVLSTPSQFLIRRSRASSWTRQDDDNNRNKKITRVVESSTRRGSTLKFTAGKRVGRLPHMSPECSRPPGYQPKASRNRHAGAAYGHATKMLQIPQAYQRKPDPHQRRERKKFF